MQINKADKLVTFSELKSGDCFEVEGVVYMKTDLPAWQAIRLDDGIVVTLPLNTQVRLYPRATVVLAPRETKTC